MTSDEIARLIRGVDHRDPKRDVATEVNPEFVEVTERLLKIAENGTEWKRTPTRRHFQEPAINAEWSILRSCLKQKSSTRKVICARRSVLPRDV